MNAPTISFGDLEVARVHDATGLTIGPHGHKRGPWEARLAQTWGDGLKGEWAPTLAICKGCAREIDASPTVLKFGGIEMPIQSTVCEDCMVLVREHYDPDRRPDEDDATQSPKWDANCPQRHKQVALGEVKPPAVDWTAFERTCLWTPDAGRGMILTGAPGTGKTSAFWKLARQLEIAGHAPITLGSLEFGRILAEAAKDIRDVGWLYRCRVLMVDDLGKERASPAVAALLWEVLDRRLSANLPVIFTTNFDGIAFSKRFAEEHLGDAIRRRIAELCRQVKFSAPI